MKPVEVRFFNKVKKSDGCWLWSAAKDSRGYGQIKIEGKTRLAHRLSWEIHNGEIPAGMWILHSCDVPLCVRPDHLFLGTAKDNAQDRDSKHRTAYMAGIVNPSAKLTDGDVRRIRMLSGHVSAADLAGFYGVNRTQIHRIIAGNAWRHIS